MRWYSFSKIKSKDKTRDDALNKAVVDIINKQLLLLIYYDIIRSRHLPHRRLRPHHPRRAAAAPAADPPRVPRRRRGASADLAVRDGAPPPPRIPRGGDRLLRSPARGGGSGNPQPGVGGGRCGRHYPGW